MSGKAKIILIFFSVCLIGAGIFYSSNAWEEGGVQTQFAQNLEADESGIDILHETCQEYFRRRLSEGWKCISLEGYNAVLLSPEGVRRELDLRNDVETLRPNAAGDENGILDQNGEASPNHWMNVDEVTSDGSATAVVVREDEDLRDLYNLSAHTGTGTINKITVYINATDANYPTAYAQTAIKTGGLVDEGTEVTLTNSFVLHSKEYTTNPQAGGAWTWAQLDALQAGVAMRCGSGGTQRGSCTQVYVEVDYTPPVAPTVTTQAATSVEATTATGNGNITATGGANATRRGFCYMAGTSGDPTTANSVAYDDGSFGTGAYTKGLTGLSTGTSYRVRAYAVNSAGTGYGTTVQILTKPAAPTSVAATDGAHTDKVVITWTKSTGATNYHVWRDAVDLGAAGDVATFDDTGAGAPTITPGTAAASDGTSTAHVALGLSGQSANNGATYTYKVVASNATGNSVDSATNTGYRGVGSLTYQWQRSAADSDATYSNISGATTASYNDTGAPAYAVNAPTSVTVSAESTSVLRITYSGASVTAGAGRYYKCVLNATGASQ